MTKEIITQLLGVVIAYIITILMYSVGLLLIWNRLAPFANFAQIGYWDCLVISAIFTIINGLPVNKEKR